MRPVGLLLGGVDFADLFILLKAGDPAAPYLSLTDAQAAGAVTVLRQRRVASRLSASRSGGARVD